MNLDPYRHTELVVFPPNKVEKFPLDLQGTMEKMVFLGILKDAGAERNPTVPDRS